ncbi:Urea ABC transporter, permease protein UrtB [Olavius sp. associated proteobacterium Delta 1]|nr:Urea ABC transporter, permease protein UrtB [Olavius sp. associated proteobacterium Delta 1]
MDLIIPILNSINYILVLILVAMGLVIIFGLMRVINMAHGEFFLIGAYTVVMADQIGLGFWIGLLLSPIVVGLFGMIIEYLFIRHLYRRFLDTILATWGLSIAIKQLVIIIFGPEGLMVRPPLPQSIHFAGLEYPAYRLFIMGVALVIIFITFYIFFRTDFGLGARSVIANRDMAAALGINTRRMYRTTFTFGSALAGLAGAVMAPLMSCDPQMGLGFFIPAFLSILVGGAGTLGGILVGGAVVGGSDSFISFLFSPVTAQIVVFSLAIVLIRFRPQGLIGTKRRG